MLRSIGSTGKSDNMSLKSLEFTVKGTVQGDLSICAWDWHRLIDIISAMPRRCQLQVKQSSTVARTMLTILQELDGKAGERLGSYRLCQERRGKCRSIRCKKAAIADMLTVRRCRRCCRRRQRCSCEVVSAPFPEIYTLLSDFVCFSIQYESARERAFRCRRP